MMNPVEAMNVTTRRDSEDHGDGCGITAEMLKDALASNIQKAASSPDMSPSDLFEALSAEISNYVVEGGDRLPKNVRTIVATLLGLLAANDFGQAALVANELVAQLVADQSDARQHKHYIYPKIRKSTAMAFAAFSVFGFVGGGCALAAGKMHRYWTTSGVKAALTQAFSVLEESGLNRHALKVTIMRVIDEALPVSPAGPESKV